MTATNKQFVVKIMAKRVNILRTQQKLTLEALSVRAGLSKSHVWDVEHENQTNPTINTVARLSKALGCSLEYFIGASTELPTLHPEALRMALEIHHILEGNQS